MDGAAGEESDEGRVEEEECRCPVGFAGWREARRVDGAPLFLEGEEGELTRDVPVAADPPPDD